MVISDDVHIDHNTVIVSPIMRKLVEGLVQETVDDIPKGSDPDDDSPFERTLCAAWDVCTVKEYAQVIASAQFHRVLLKIITVTQRNRTRELAMGALANMACHWDSIGRTLLDDMDVLRLCRSILWHENDSRVLLETARLLNTFLSCSIDASHQTIIEHDHLTEFFTPVPMTPSVFHQFTLIVCNTLYSELLMMSLELMMRMVVYTNAVTHSLARRDQDNQFIEKSDTLMLIRWGAERLEEEGRGVGIGMGFNRGIAKNVMHLLWALMAYGMASTAECGPDMTNCLGQSMSRIVSYIQEDEYEHMDDDDDIQNLAQALNTKLSMAS
ncbi:hypothetical protein DFQ28_004207 [Apophysomyces sp. BC1034]|nr:hypothetical protein DFQ30_004249 [Apophysomyces sp. BC1015]KAG0178500.1 hypothetical protein DFQ29_003408 [Apophysomyces sp. BC1021]KAG0188897.1 hypothetical protein DFQ28_004207 [Apophysomyces sp. BC1034]